MKSSVPERSWICPACREEHFSVACFDGVPVFGFGCGWGGCLQGRRARAQLIGCPITASNHRRGPGCSGRYARPCDTQVMSRTRTGKEGTDKEGERSGQILRHHGDFWVPHDLVGVGRRMGSRRHVPSLFVPPAFLFHFRTLKAASQNGPGWHWRRQRLKTSCMIRPSRHRPTPLTCNPSSCPGPHLRVLFSLSVSHRINSETQAPDNPKP